ncbi:DUF4177 domain-containing protein [Clostridium sporogenes]|uniref:DUF4177 domain-containing protein n=1 Tax=Clostridium sporogenes TaxID=1509 RepID=UPI0013D73D3E|nr:DUF4177 domain-containing protein [Clostridium sporogenes]NFP91385.1 DUF4177 domain-containing protein [Clostridium sporogenes]
MKWEYKVIEINSIKNLGSSINLQNELNNYGEEGWELVGALKKPHEGMGWMPKPDDGSVIFKRAISI